MPNDVTLPAWALEMQANSELAADPVTIEWMRSRPDAVKTLLRRLPPNCIVRGLRPLMVPWPGHFGIVVSYRERGTVTVIHHPSERELVTTGDVRAECDPDWLETVAFCRGLTPEAVDAILGQEQHRAQ